jgi:hypothetical protein
MSITVRLDDVEAWSAGGTLPPGVHLCRIDEAAEGKSSGGHPQIELLLRATNGEYAGGKIRDWLVVTAGSLGKVKQLMEAAAVPIPGGEFAINTNALVGRAVMVVVREEKDRTDPSVMRSRVKGYEAVAGQAAAPGNGTGAARQDTDIPF